MDLKRKEAFAELRPDELRWTCGDEAIPFSTTAEVAPCDEIIGQERALKALETGLEIKSRGYNIFLTGMVGTGRTTTIKQLLERLEKGGPAPDDICYVNNFKYPDEPVLVMLPAGQGKMFAADMDRIIETLTTNIPELFKSTYYIDKRDAIVEAQQRKQKDQAPGGGKSA